MARPIEHGIIERDFWHVRLSFVHLIPHHVTASYSKIKSLLHIPRESDSAA